MSLRVKILIIFLLSIFISVIIFMGTTVLLLYSTLWGGTMNENTMKKAADEIVAQLIEGPYDKNRLVSVIEEASKARAGMNFDILSPDMDWVYSSSGQTGKYPVEDLIQRLSNHGSWGQQEWVVAKDIKQGENRLGYLVVSVSKENYQPISLWVNSEGEGIIGKIFIVGLGITIITVCTFAFLFTMNTSRRFTNLVHKISSFQLGNLDVIANDGSKDEIGKLANTFNGMALNIREQIARENTLQQERQVLLSNISHDLRTPLTAIVGYSESLENRVFNKEREVREFAGVIRKSALYMEKLLDELLTYLKFERGNYPLNLEVMDLGELCREILIEYIPLLQGKGIELEIKIGDQPIEVKMDRGSFSRALRNIIDNAIKYSSEGKFLGVSLHPREKDVGLFLSDHGEGIGAEHLEKIFERFYRGEQKETNSGGMGLGLSIAKDIIERHGGTLGVESQLGQGTTFSIWIPLACQEIKRAL